MATKKEELRLKRHRALRRSIQGTQERPRLAVRRSLNNLFAQIVDDTASKTLFSASTQDKDIKKQFPRGGNVKTAEVFGQMFAKKAVEKGIKKVVFDRAGYLYHGRVKAFADSARKGGLEF